MNAHCGHHVHQYQGDADKCEIKRLRKDYGQVVKKFDDCRAALARRVEDDTGRLPHPLDDDSRDWHTWLIEQSDKAIQVMAKTNADWKEKAAQYKGNLRRGRK